MPRPLHASLALLLALVASPARAGGIDVTLHGGLDQYDALGLERGTTSVRDSGRLKDASQHVGATVILRDGLRELGLIGELGRPGKDATTTTLGLLAGLGLDLGPIRLEALGEAGAHRYGNVLQDPSVVRQGSGDAWLVAVGLRPGLSMRFGPGDMLLLGLWGFARWDVTSKDVQVSLAGTPGSETTYRLGGTQFGASVRLGFSL